MSGLYEWLTTTPLGLAAAVGGLMLIFVLVTFFYERKTRKLFPDRAKRGKRKAKKP